MDLTQNKLSRQEWNNLEIPVNEEEKQILNLIIKGYYDFQLTINNNHSMLSLLKINEPDDNIQLYLYDKYFKDIIEDLNKKYKFDSNIKYAYTIEKKKHRKLKTNETLKLNNLDKNMTTNKEKIIEYIILDLYKYTIKNLQKKKSSYILGVYTLIQIFKTKIRYINYYLHKYINSIIENLNENIKIKDVLAESYDLIERNSYIFEYEDKQLFEHQKQIYNIFQSEKYKNNSKLVFYTAPTGTGKTLTPLGLSNEYRVIFVCVARHIGLALAKSSISMGKKIAFAFGCDTSTSIRLHNFSACEYDKNEDGNYIKLRDGKKKIDHSVGRDVEIMICDVRSYISAMNYMLEFNDEKNLITFWDEPTITLDYDNHELHDTISQNWKNNKISNLILSCATLPNNNDIENVINDFNEKFAEVEVFNITSNDFKKTIPIVDTKLNSICPHFQYENYEDMKNCVNYCNNNKTLLRYFDLTDIINFIMYCSEQNFFDIDSINYNNYFENITAITMISIKEYYLFVLNELTKDNYINIFKYFQKNNQVKYKTKGNGVQFTTHDASTLTDGPTIFLCEDTNKIGNFYIQQSNIPTDIFKAMLVKITKNDEIAEEINKIEKLIFEREEKLDKASNLKESDEGKGKDTNKNNTGSKEENEWHRNINKLRKQILLITLDSKYVPNSVEHQKEWCNDVITNRFMPQIDTVTTKEIMSLKINNNLKVLLLLGIGVFMKDAVANYTEFMKKLANEQKLFIIIASSDYIYGTNYQFCHGIIGKDLSSMTQQKTLQALGRIGRNNIQQNYSIRFRNDDLIRNLFKESEHNIEAINMNRLFTN